MMRQCTGTTKTGAPCKARGGQVDPKTMRCQMHDPEREELWRLRRSRGARTALSRKHGTKVPPVPTTLEEASSFAASAAWAVASGAIGADKGRAAQALLREFRDARQALDVSRELETLKATVARLKQERGSL